jgi:nitrate reductase gamma subunit
MTTVETFVWTVLPYIAIATLGVGLFWRYKYDKFGWTTRSSQMYESRLLRLGSPLFHVGILLALGGHIVGLVIPESWTSALGIDEDLYHVTAVTLGSIAGVMVVSGLGILVYRRRTVPRVFQVTTPMDKAMYLVLGSVVLLGAYNTIGVNLLNLPGGYPDGYNYRETIAPWFRGVFVLDPQPELMSEAPFTFQLHVLLAMVLFTIWPFTRLVHVLSAPIGYLSRPYIVYRSRGAHDDAGSRDPSRGWEPTRR